MNQEDEVFKGKKLGDLFKDIYDKSQTKDRQIKMLIGELRPLIKNIGDATVIVPLIKEYMDVSIKNDDHIIKMTAIVQRLISGAQRTIANGGGSGAILTQEEKDQLLSDLDDVVAGVEDTPTEDDSVKDKIDDIKNKLKPDDEDEDI